jgi:excinuclease ABC subunit A
MHPIQLRGARTHYLRGIDLELRPGQLCVVTGISGAGKSSLAFDTLYAEAQRRFVESFSPYARQYLERLERPPIASLEPVAAGVAVDRRAPVKSSRATLATMADLEAYVSALFTACAAPRCPACGVLAEYVAPAAAARDAVAAHPGRRVVVSYAHAVAGGEAYLEARDQLVADGYRRIVLGDEVADLDRVPPSAVARTSELDVVIDRLTLDPAASGRLAQALEQAWRLGGGRAALHLDEGGSFTRTPRTQGLACKSCGRSFARAKSGLFSYQSALGSCATCRGFGRVLGIDWDKVVPDPALSVARGAVRPWRGKKTSWERRMLLQFCEAQGIPTAAPWSDLTADQRMAIRKGEGRWARRFYPGLETWFRRLESKQYKMHVRVLLARYRAYEPCTACGGKRLGPEALMYRVDGLDIGDWHRLELSSARARLLALELPRGHAALVRDELVTRLGYLEAVGLGYLTLDRQARTLSGGEGQRVALTAALGSSLTGALFVLDEPTVGLHVHDVAPLVNAMRALARRGNAVLVVEHDDTVIAAADRVIELGPGAGRDGGDLVFDGTPSEARGRLDLATGRALEARPAAAVRRTGTGRLVVRGASANNLRNVTVHLPLRALTAICGPSGSGKSTLVEEVMHRALARRFGESDVEAPGAHEGIDGADDLARVVLVDQSPLGRTSRGNAATYTGAWARIRARFAAQPEAELAGLTAGHFSFNVALGRCDACAGEGAETVEMQFLADVRLTCPVCRGRRFRDEVLEVTIAGRSVADVLELSLADVARMFADDAVVARALAPAIDLGLGYLPLGQPLSTLSGGEAQRLKLARALSDSPAGTLFLLDEPSAGLHRDEVMRLCAALVTLVERGASVVAVDHDLDVIAAADWVIELGPGAGAHGGAVVAAATPEELIHLTTETGVALAARSGERRRDARVIGDGAGELNGTPPAVISVSGAREHNLANVDVAIPMGKLVVVTGPSGSGKSSLCFDVVFAEAQRRFLETLTPYSRQFLPVMARPDVDRMSGLPPAVALEQRTARAGAHSTVATVTEIAHYLRLLYAKVGVMFCPDCDVAVAHGSADALFQRITARRGSLSLRAPVVRARKGVYRDVFDAADRAGIASALCDGVVVVTSRPPRLVRSKEHSIDLVVYQGRAKELDRASLDRALSLGKGQVVVGPASLEPWDAAGDESFSTARACPRCARSFPELDPRWFSFNTRQGRCEACDGTGFEDGEDAILDADDGPPAVCPACHGSRLSPLPRAVRLDGERYHEMSARSVESMVARVRAMSFAGDAGRVAAAPLGELARRLAFVERIGLGYLTLGRRAGTLSGGEMQRLRLAAQLGSGLTGALYVLDEPTIGLHPSDTQRLIDNLRALVAMGSTVLVVEHDADTIRAADELIDLGPGGGRQGGRIMAQGAPRAVLASPSSPTARALADEGAFASLRQPFDATRRAPSELVLRDARANNLRIAELKIPLGRMVVVAGVSGSGKSTLVRQVLYPALRRALGLVAEPVIGLGAFELAPGLERAIAVDQTPIGRTPRSVPATYIGIWDAVRRVFAALPEARARGYRPQRFSFNAAGGGRCAGCDGRGQLHHEMAFLPDMETTCDSCGGLRFDPATLEVRYRGLSIGDVLRLTADDACEIFAAHRSITPCLETLRDLGVGYVELGQSSATLSGGEAQRLKLAKELGAGRQHRPTLYVLDEPTTGLHHSDVARLVTVLDRLVQRGDSLVIIEHHPAVIAAADHIIELGPRGGEGGGRVIAAGSVDDLRRAATATGDALRRLVEPPKGSTRPRGVLAPRLSTTGGGG